MFARVNIIQGDPAKTKQYTEYTKNTIQPALKKIKGHKGMLQLADPVTGKAYSITFWDSEADMKASEESAGSVRSHAVSDLGITAPPMVERMEVVLDTRA
jgi:heme-degrading monooxygenase HmoA